MDGMVKGKQDDRRRISLVNVREGDKRLLAVLSIVAEGRPLVSQL